MTSITVPEDELPIPGLLAYDLGQLLNYPSNQNQSGQPGDPFLPYGVIPPQRPGPAVGFNAPPPMNYPANSFGAPYPPQTAAGFPSFQQPYPSPNLPYPGGNNSNLPYPGGNNSPYPGGNNSNLPYPGGNNSPYPGGNNSPYPGGNNYCDPAMGAPYPGHTASPPGNPPQPPLSNCPPYPQPSSSLPSVHSVAGAYPKLSESSSNISHHFPSHTSSSHAVHSHVQESVQVSHHSSLSAAPSKVGQHPVPKQPVKPSPTIVPAPNFDSRTDAEVLRKAMKGLGTDEKAIIQVLAHRTNMQRLEITTQYKTLYGKDLIKDLKSELRGRFEELVLAAMTPLPQFYAKELHDALSGIGTDEACLVEILASASNHYIQVIRSTYQAMFGKPLEEELKGDTSGHFRRLLVSLCQGHRDENPNVNEAAVTQDAQALLKAGKCESRFGTDESTFNAVLASRSYHHLQRVMAEYERLSGHSLEKAIKKEFSGDIMEGLLAIVKSAANRPRFFAERLHNSMAGMGTKDRTLIRIIVTRSEVDLADIKAEFHRTYGKSLQDFISVRESIPL
ncbi:hypothetical protein J437_LFUL013917 [Ladona fulva]|uniref:Annexin n=1 Tax=Ladona fulva TaxID=123851 RepID=A0A8K0KGX3_LADFU|nr:hypothetical protein J437_LFUL013917 [Ladona fulva]